MEPKSEEESRRVDISYPNFATSSSLGVEILHALPIRCPDSPPENQELIEIPLSPEKYKDDGCNTSKLIPGSRVWALTNLAINWEIFAVLERNNL